MLETSILGALSYSDIFTYPLKKDEIWKWLGEKATQKEVEVSLKKLTAAKVIQKKNSYFFLPGKVKTVNLRLKREKISQEKFPVVQKAIEQLKKIPFIKFIGLTGALSMNNSEDDDDIDFMIITRKESLWLCRALILLLSPLLKIKRRKPGDKQFKDKICLNLFLDEARLEIKEKNLFTAHEICQVKALYNKDRTYEKFIAANAWVKNYLPNAIPGSLSLVHCSNTSLRFKPFIFLMSFLNKISFRLQYLYMRAKITNEKVSLHQAFFHPKKPKYP